MSKIIIENHAEISLGLALEYAWDYVSETGCAEGLATYPWRDGFELQIYPKRGTAETTIVIAKEKKQLLVKVPE